jgi:hypothetical protein
LLIGLPYRRWRFVVREVPWMRHPAGQNPGHYVDGGLKEQQIRRF